MRRALMRKSDRVVINVIVLDDEAKYAPPPGCILLPPGDYEIGDVIAPDGTVVEDEFVVVVPEAVTARPDSERIKHRREKRLKQARFRDTKTRRRKTKVAKGDVVLDDGTGEVVVVEKVEKRRGRDWPKHRSRNWGDEWARTIGVKP